MDQLSCMKTFIEVAQSKSFSMAARHMGLSRGSVTKHIAALEKAFGARLLIRNSQFVSLTEAGEVMLQGAVRLVEDFDMLGDKIEGKTTGLIGKIRVGVPPRFGTHYLAPLAIEFLSTVTDVQIDMFLDDGTSNLVREGLDISIRISPSLQSTDEIAKFLAVAPQVAVASPTYLESRPAIRHPDDLRQHSCLIHALKAPTAVWTFTGPEGEVSVSVHSDLRSNFGEPLLQAAILGHGITIHPIYMVKEYLNDGRLQVVLPDYQATPMRIHAVYPQRRYLPARMRLFLDFLKKKLDELSEGTGTTKTLV